MKTVVVTGASRGIGRAICEKLMEEGGYKVIGLARETKDGPKGVDMRACDVGDSANVEAALKDVVKDPNLWGLINTAGIAKMNFTMSTPYSTVDRIVRTNLLGTIHTSIALAKRFVRNKQGRIINFSTIAVPISLKGESIYVASKAGVEGFSRSFAREMSDFNVTVNVVAPGPIPTDLLAKVPDAAIDQIVSHQIHQKRYGVESVVTLVMYLLREESHMLTGEVLAIGGA